MAVLRKLTTGELHTLSANDLVGRQASSDLRLEARQVSGAHASLKWNGEAWEVRDLGSRNGTFVDGRRLDPGAALALGRGRAIAFGDPEETWQLVDVAAPVAMGVCAETREVVLAEDGILALPGAHQPEATVYRARDGRWRVEREGLIEGVEDQTVVTSGGRIWRLRLPDPETSTVAKASSPELSLERVSLSFRVSQDEEHVTLTAREGERVMKLGSRAHHYPLLVLARALLEDRSALALPPSEQGWRYQDDLVKQLGTDDERLYVDIYRARKQLGAAGVSDAAGVIERRTGTRQLRLGVGDVTIERG